MKPSKTEDVPYSLRVLRSARRFAEKKQKVGSLVMRGHPRFRRGGELAFKESDRLQLCLNEVDVIQP